jgi:NADH-quinone oxidoreductase subunit L
LFTYLTTFIADWVGIILLIASLLPLAGIVFMVSFPKRGNAGLIFSAIALLQLLLLLAAFLSTYSPGRALHLFYRETAFQYNPIFTGGLYIDFLAWLMVVTLALVSFLVALYAMGYFKVAYEKRCYFIQIGGLMVGSYWIILADNLFVVYVGWEMVGLLSGLLVGLRYTVFPTIQAGSYVMLMNRVGSLFLLIGILLAIHYVGTSSLHGLQQFYVENHPGLPTWFYWMCGFFILAALAKMAQFPFFSWLPRAMVAPIPVSALLHTAAVLGVGIYFLCRMGPLLAPAFLHGLVVIGYVTVFLASTSAFAQRRPKRMLAYSTIASVGLITVALGLHMPGHAMWYFVVHTLAKVCLFLCVGIVERFYIRPTSVTYSGWSFTLASIRQLPLAASSYLLAVVVLAGLPALKGFSAKELLIQQTFFWSMQRGAIGAYVVLLINFFSNFLTILYLFKSFFLLFPPKMYRTALISEQGDFRVMRASLVMLTALLVLTMLPGVEGFILKQVYALYPSHATFKAISKADAYFMKLWTVAIWAAAGIGLFSFLKRIGNKASAYPQKPIQLLLQGWYLYAGTWVVARKTMAMSRWLVRVEEGLHQASMYMGTSFLLMGRLVAFIDRKFLSAAGYALAGFLVSLGSRYDRLQKGCLQFQLIWTLGAIVLLLLAAWLLGKGLDILR